MSETFLLERMSSMHGLVLSIYSWFSTSYRLSPNKLHVKRKKLRHRRGDDIILIINHQRECQKKASNVDNVVNFN